MGNKLAEKVVMELLAFANEQLLRLMEEELQDDQDKGAAKLLEKLNGRKQRDDV